MKKIAALVACAVAALTVTAATASADVSFGVSDDAGKYAPDGGAAFLSMLGDIGFRENRVTVRWDPARPTTIVDAPHLTKFMPKAAARGVRVIFAVYPDRANGVTATPSGQAQFVQFLELVARTYPQVKDFIVGNEPNQPRFWQPQYNGDGSPAAGAAYEALLAQSYDALKAIDANINVIGVGLSPRGNDNASARSNVSTSPVRFIRDLGAAYRTSARAVPIMDEFAFHPYPNSPSDTIAKGYQWPNAGVSNLDRIKQAVWDAFHGTGQPVFSESPSAFSLGGFLRLRLDEVGWQVGIVPSSQGAYFGKENVAVTDEATQASIYGDLVGIAECDANVSGLSYFGFVDEADLDRFQAGLVRADGSRRPSYDSVKNAIAESGGRCGEAMKFWRHASRVIGARANWNKLGRKAPYETYWSFFASATEDASYKAGIFRLAGPSANKQTIGRALATTNAPTLALSTTGSVKAYWSKLVRFPARRLKPGRYVYAIRLTAEMNPERTSLFVSRPFRVGKADA